MKRLFRSVILCAISSIAIASDLQSGIDKILNDADPSLNIGMVVVDLNTGNTLYQRNPTQPFVPASNMKLFSDAAALLALGPDYRFKTQLTTDATILENGILKGSLYLQLSGDPSFTQADLDALLSQLTKWNIKRIQGNLIFVSNNSVVSAYAPGRMAQDNNYSYGAPIAPVVFDENRLTVTVNPAHAAGNDALVELAKPNSGLIINNQVKTAENGKKCGVSFNMDSEHHLIARGCIGVGEWSLQQEIPIKNPLQYAQNMVKSHLNNLKIKLDGEIKLGTMPSSTLLLSSHESKPITQLMADTLKPSDNLYADSLFLHTASTLSGKPLNWQEAEPVVKDFLQKETGINLENAVMIDGSGLSRKDLLTAQQTVDLLRYLHDRFPLAYEYISALPIAGQDGTLRRRFTKPSQQGLLRAKTGTMSGVMSLSGYLYTANGHTLAFAIYINKQPETKSAVAGGYRSIVDNLCDFLLQQKPETDSIIPIQNAQARVAYQQQPMYTDRQRSKFAKWRQLESSVKHALKGEDVNVLFRNNHLVLQDNGRDINKTWNSLQMLAKKYPFTVVLHSKSSPSNIGESPHLLWVKMSKLSLKTTRTWVLRESNNL